jgi:hypothetical protein
MTDLPALPANLHARGGDPSLTGAELLSLIAEHIDRHPRSQQKRIGPSELGSPCARRLGYKLLDVEPVNPRPASWRPTIGTAAHAWLEQAMQAHNDSHTHDRFYLEERVTVGQVGGEDVDGSCDCYDRVTATVIDWKVVGVTALRKYRSNGPGEQYRRQVHLYGRGFVTAGLPVDHVAIMFLPNNGELTDAHFWTEPYDQALAEDTLTRVDGIAQLVNGIGSAALPLLPTADAHCNFCPYLDPDSTDLARACPGDPGSATAQAVAPPATLADALL